ncbi:DNA-binding anti-repressor SinI [Gracilibacillus oryzae]|uniref:DNA-binding anti-repressor SinI n=1 Tax=Gracilibacillus oryzae TaxID=1672701 RepID=A0A7C8L6Y6_9BACI|nr:anti-repressor SinI family protein [Gracilibacillus oryzae]KAB8134721.1 DNA-binding anti-repressor SinI [Gracilibacillus oryzae]
MGEVLQLDYEWIYLLLEAKEAGLTVDEVKEFIEKEKLKVQEIV